MPYLICFVIILVSAIVIILKKLKSKRGIPIVPENQQEFNTQKYNKSLVDTVGIIIITLTIFIGVIPHVWSFHTGKESESMSVRYDFVLHCCFCVGFPTAYFLKNPTNLLYVLK